MKRFLFAALAIILITIIVYIIISRQESLKKFDTVENIRPKDSMIMVYVPEGEFTMGSSFLESIVISDSKLFPFHDQRPKHRVYLDAYWIDKTEVTVGQFRMFVKETGYRTTAEVEGWGRPWQDGPKASEWNAVTGADWEHPRGPRSATLAEHPVVQVSWQDACAYCEWAGARLPTEAEWEKAARGTDGRKYPWGNEFNGKYLNYGDSSCPVGRWRDLRYNDGYVYTSPVGSYPSGASPYGALDMAGNVWEWVNDWYDEDYYARSPNKNPQGPATGNLKSMRGGSWYDGNARAWVTVVVRHQNPVLDRYEDVGFRCASNKHDFTEAE